MSRLSQVAALALSLSLPAAATAQYPYPYPPPEAEDPGPRGLQLTLLGGAFNPTGISMEGFPWGSGIAGRIGYRLGSSYGFELELRRSASTLEDAAGSLQMVQSSASGALRIFGTLGPLRTEGSFGFGWYRLRLVSDAVDEAGQSRLGFVVNGAVAFPIAGPLELLVGATYGGAYSNVFDYNPIWVAGWTIEGGLRVTFDPGPRAPAATPPGS